MRPGLPARAEVSLASGLDQQGHGGAADGGAGSGSFANGDGTAALQQLTTAPAASSDAASAPTVHIKAEVDSSDFPQGLADKVSFAVDNGWSSAKLSVNPPQLGPIELQIAVQGEHAQVAMSTHSAVTREALESSVPKLRDMLSSQGFTQVSVDISQRSFQERSAPSQPYVWTPGSSAAHRRRILVHGEGLPSADRHARHVRLSSRPKAPRSFRSRFRPCRR